MLTVDSLDQWLLIVAFRSFVTEDHVQASLVYGDWVCASHDAHVLEHRRCRMSVAVAVNAHIVHHVDVQDFALHVVVDTLCRGSHTLQEQVLRRPCREEVRPPSLLGVVGLACAVYVGLACRRCHANRGVLQDAAETSHRMSLEMSKVDHEVVVVYVFADDVVLEVCRVLDCNPLLPELVHQVDREDAVESMLMNSLPVVLGVLACSSVGCAAFDDVAVHLLDQGADKSRLQVMIVASFACADLDGDAPLGFYAESLVGPH